MPADIVREIVRDKEDRQLTSAKSTGNLVKIRRMFDYAVGTFDTRADNNNRQNDVKCQNKMLSYHRETVL